VGFPYSLDLTNYHDETVNVQFSIYRTGTGGNETETDSTPTFEKVLSVEPDESIPFEDVFDCPDDRCRYTVSYTINDEHTGESSFELQDGSKGYVSFEIRAPSDVSVRPTMA
jgi:hypothetical protein